MHKVFALIGSSGAGKTALMLECVRRLNGAVTILPSLTTRPWRGPEDDAFYLFVDEAEIRRRDVVAIFAYAGFLYANDHATIREILANRHAICALIEQGVLNHRRAGYAVVAVHVVAIGKSGGPSAERIAADRAREGSIAYNYEIMNDFGPGGFERAVQQLIGIISAPAS